MTRTLRPVTFRRWSKLLWLIATLGCEHKPPPGAGVASAEPAVVTAGDPEAAVGAPAVEATPRAVRGTIDDNLPFKPTGKKLASIAWRTWVYTDVGPKRKRYGYIRAGEILDVREPGIGPNDGCKGGWYRINPRGFVCIGKGATLDLEHPVVKASAVRPVLGQGLPYLYGMSSETPPLKYFKLPSMDSMTTSEGKHVLGEVKRWRMRAKLTGVFDILGTPGAPPEFLAGGKALDKPYGVETGLRFANHAGRASADSGWALQSVFEHNDRVWGLTTELDILTMDRVKVVRPSKFHGAAFEKGETLPLAIVARHMVPKYVQDEAGKFKTEGHFDLREAVKLTGKTEGTPPMAFNESTTGEWILPEGVRLIKPRTSFPSFAKANRKWIDISIEHQTLVAYEGQRPVYATLISSGRGGMGDPEKVHATVRGTFMIHSKHVTTTMDGEEDKSDSFNLLDVPFVQYFHKGYALHGTYWHDEFGKVRSHGCVNLSPIDSAWLFNWTDPVVPPGWHHVLNKERGTVVYIHK